MSTEANERWRVGELAGAAGLTVRALHHYDELGLLVPSERTHSGHRLYGAADVSRLYRIVALRRLGLRLEEIGELLDGDVQLSSIVARQLETVARELHELQRLRDRLIAIAEVLDREDEPSVDLLIGAMEATTMHEKYFTTGQLEQLETRRLEVGDEEMTRVGEQWREVFAALQAEKQAGTDPADPRLAPLRARSRELVARFTGGDTAIGASLAEMWANEDPAAVSRGMVDRDLWDYYSRMCRSGD